MRLIPIVLFAALSIFSLPGIDESLAAEGGKRISLPKPVTTGGMPLMDALSARASNRKFADKILPDQVLSNLLWATWGINRPDGHRTAPTALNKQDIRVYAAMENGVWFYDAAKNELALAMEGDTRAVFGGAPVTLLYAVPESSPAGGMHAGSLYQNAGLFCASEGLANVVKTSQAGKLDGKLFLPQGYTIVVVQSIGYPQ